MTIVTACGQAPHDVATDAAGTSDASAIDAARDGAVVVPGHVLLGAYTNQGGSETALFGDLEAALGHKLAIENQREPWVTMFDKMDEHADVGSGVIPMISWTVEMGGSACATPEDILAGTYDGQLANQGKALASFGVPVLVRFYKEFTDAAIDPCFYGDDMPGKNAATDGPKFVMVWQHVHDIVVANGGSNVQWVWGPSAGLFSKGSDSSPNDVTWRYFWPGDSYVDWIANDNYNKTVTPMAYDADPDIANWYALMSGKGKPMMQSETGAGYLGSGSGSGSNGPDPQTEWVTTAYEAMPTKYPMMAAFVWWNAQGDQDYRLQGSGLAEFSTMANDPYFERTTLP